MDIQDQNSITKYESAPITTAEPYYPSNGVEQIELRHVWDALCRRWKLMLCTLVIVLIAGGVYTVKQKPVYESSAMLVIAGSQQISSSSDDVRVLSDVAALTKDRSVESQVEIITSQDLLQQAFREFDEEKIHRGFGGPQVPPWAISVDSKKDSDVITVSAKAFNPEVAAELANTVVTTYLQRDETFSSQASKQGREYVSQELDTVRSQLTNAQKALSDYKQKTRLIVADAQLQSMATNMLNLQAEQDKANVELAGVKRQKQALNSQLVAQGTHIDESQSIQMSPEYQAAMSTLGALSAKRASLIQDYTPQAPEIKKVDGAIAETQAHMKQIAQTVVASKNRIRNPILSDYVNSVVNGAAADARLRTLNRVVAQRNKQIAAMPEQERAMTKLMQNVTTLQGTYQMLSQKYYTLLLNEKSTLPGARFASSAHPNYVPSAPNKKKNAALFFLLGLMLAVAAAAVAERLDDRVRDEEFVEQMTGESALAVIPDEKSLRKSMGVISDIDHRSPFAEAFRILRNVIILSSAHKDLKLLAITSPGRGEGKSTTCVNLANAVAMTGRKVLLVDCDLRCPSLHARLGLDPGLGFTDVVSKSISPEIAIVETKFRGVYCLPSGPLPANPAELLNSPESRALLSKLADEYDVVILDCPPCAGLSDMQVVSTIAQGVLLVVTVDQTLKPSLTRTIKALAQVGAPVIGFVVNRLNVKRSGYDYYYYGERTAKHARRRKARSHRQES